ncbi:hypothetical protein MHB42_13485 [Lysinibacillus sp. FSL K6-0232]|uniref:hypothetical protein n=1 Tax=Lysinibacillus sp. FSL K6-0232 TaxID=2921425 RepID=UPI0030F8FA9A
MALTDEQVNLLLEDEEFGRYTQEYNDYKITYRDFKVKMDEVYKRRGIKNESKPINHQERIKRVEKLFAKGYIDKDRYENRLNRIKQDIKDESSNSEEKKQVGIEINGCVFANNGDIDLDDFLDKFIEFIEENGWHFGGGTNHVDEDGNYIK